MGMRASFHSVMINRIVEMELRVSMAMTMGLDHWKYVPPPEIGIRSNSMAILLNVIPIKSIALSLSLGSPVTLLPGRMKSTMTPEVTARGQSNLERPRHVDFSINAAVRNGPMTFPPPTQEPRMP